MGLCRSVDITINCTNFEIKFISVIIYSYIYKYKLSYVQYLQGRTGPKCGLSAASPPPLVGGGNVGVAHFSRYLWFYYERLQPHTVDIMKLTL